MWNAFSNHYCIISALMLSEQLCIVLLPTVEFLLASNSLTVLLLFFFLPSHLREAEHLHALTRYFPPPPTCISLCVFVLPVWDSFSCVVAFGKQGWCSELCVQLEQMQGEPRAAKVEQQVFVHLEGCWFAQCTNAWQCYHSADRVLKRSLKFLIQPAAS